MSRYLVIHWDDTHPAQRIIADELVSRIGHRLKDMSSVANGAGFAAFAADLCPGLYEAYPLTSDCGVILGKIFHRHVADSTRQKKVVLDSGVSEKIISTAGKRLLDHYWGRYVAFIFNKENGMMNVIRDPSGSLHCFATVHHDIHILFSYAEDLIALDVMRFSINWRYVYACLSARLVDSPISGLNEILQVRQGERLTLHRNGTVNRTLCWNPFWISESDPIEDADTAVQIARETIQGCIAAWASCYAHIVLRYSGGFDSTIVLHCLRQATSRSKITCLNYFDPPADPQEEEYLHRAIAATAKDSHSPVELLKYAHCPETVRLNSLVSVKRFPCLPYYKGWLMGEPHDAAAAIERGAALFDGMYGDQVFLSDTTHTAIDYIWRHPRLELARSANLGQPPEEIMWRAVASMIRLGNSTQRAQIVPTEYPFVNPSVFDALRSHEEEYLMRYWIQHQPNMVPPGKRRHITMMCAPSNPNFPFPDRHNVERVAPLLSQPIMELFLRMPTYVLNSGALNRTVVRKAFWDFLPKELHSESAIDIGRRDQFNCRHLDVLRHNEAFMKEILLEGILAKEGILNRKAAERYFTEYRQAETGDIGLLEFCFDMEIWLQSWKSLRNL